LVKSPDLPDPAQNTADDLFAAARADWGCREIDPEIVQEGVGHHCHQRVAMENCPGTALEVVKIEFFLELLVAWARAGRPVEAHFHESGAHGFTSAAIREKYFAELFSWMEFRKLTSGAAEEASTR
jgi:hypothetical protein